MVAMVLLLAGLFTAASDEVKSADRDTYEAARARAGRDADAHVALALWCESHGLEAERMKHLAVAAIIDPGHALARGLLGLVEYRGRWQRPEAVGELTGRDAVLAEYRGKRDAAANTADAQWALAVWCEEAGLQSEAAAHFQLVTTLDPRREAAWKRLGYKRQGGRWVTEAQLAEEKAEADRQRQADRHWKPLLEKSRERLESKTRHVEAEQALAEVTDPRAVPMVWATFVMDKRGRQAVAVRVLGQIDAPGASRALAMLAVFGGSGEVRRAATETLRRRDVREFADLLIGLVRDPIKYEVKPVGGPGSPGEIVLEGDKANVKRRYAPPAGPDAMPLQPGDRFAVDQNGLPILYRNLAVFGSTPFRHFSYWMGAPDRHRPKDPAQEQRVRSFLAGSGLGPDALRGVHTLFEPNSGWDDANPYRDIMAESFMLRPSPNGHTLFSFTYGQDAVVPVGQMALEARKSAVAAQEQLQNDVNALERHNATVRESNERVVPILKEVAGQDLGDDHRAWEAWWVDQIGFRILPQKASDKPTITEDVPLDYQPTPPPIALINHVVGFRRISCFGAGTLVHTLSGSRTIESLKVGDRVLTQNTHTGALGYQPILVVHHNPPSTTMRITLGDETVVSSLFHRFWKAGQGWVMARDLVPGDTIRTLGGLVRVSSIAEDEVQPVFNLDVAGDADFFVGRQGALVHDNTLPDLRLPPFDVGRDLAVAAPSGASR